MVCVGRSMYRLTTALRRTFDITERAKFIFGVDCQNVTNTVTFGNNASNNTIGVNVDNCNFRDARLCQRRSSSLSAFRKVYLLKKEPF